MLKAIVTIAKMIMPGFKVYISVNMDNPFIDAANKLRSFILAAASPPRDAHHAGFAGRCSVIYVNGI
jgi:hypothetical protein